MKKIMLQKRIFLKSRFLRLLLMLILPIMSMEYAQASKSDFYLTVKVVSEPTGAATVYVTKTAGSASGNSELKQGANAYNASSYDWYLYAKNKNAQKYKFLGWSDADSEPADWSSVTTKTESGQKVSLTPPSGTANIRTYKAYYAPIFYFKANVSVLPDGCDAMGAVWADFSDAGAASYGQSSQPTTAVAGSKSSSTSVNASLYLKAVKNEGYDFLGWYVDGNATAISTDLEYTLTYSSSAKDAATAALTPKNVVAKFKAAGEKLTTSIGLVCNGTAYDGEEEINIDVDNTFSIDMENAPSPTGFTINQISLVDVGETEPVLTYNSDANTLYANRAGKATFHIIQEPTNEVKGKDVTFTINVKKRTPQWAYVLGNLSEGKNYSNPVSITDGLADWTLTSLKESILTSCSSSNASFSTGYLKNHTTETIKWIFSQPESYKYKAVNETISVVVEKKNTHVPVTLASSNAEALFVSASNGIVSGATYKLQPPKSSLFGALDSYGTATTIIAFEGVPDKLSCTLTGGTTNETSWKIEQSANGNSGWTSVKDETSAPPATWTLTDLQLLPTTRYLRFTYKGSATAGVIKNLKITELHLSSSPNVVICPIGDATPQVINISCANVTAISHSFPGTDGEKFNVVLNNLNAAGYDTYVQGTAEITTTATEYKKTQLTFTITQVGGTTENVIVDVYAVKRPMELPLDIATRPDDYYCFYHNNTLTTFVKANKKIEFDGVSSATTSRSVEFYFNGPAGDVSFTPSVTRDKGAYWNIYEKANAGDTYTLAHKSYLVSNTISVPLQPTSNYVKIEFAGFEGVGTITNLKITKGAYIRSNHNLISFASEGAASTTCTLTTANVNNISVSMQTGTNYNVSLSGNTLTINRTGLNASALYDMVVLSGTSAIDGKTITKYIPVNTVPSTISAANAKSTGIKTGTRNNSVSEWASTSYTIKDVNVSGAFADGKAFCDKIFIFDKSYNETNPKESNIAVSLNNISMTSCHVYTKSGDNYVYSKTIENACAATKDSEFNQTTSGTLKLYYTGFCPMLSTGYTVNDESAIYIEGNGGTSADVYLDNCFITPRKKTVEGYGVEAIWNTEEYPEGSAAALCFKNKNKSTGNAFTGNVHIRNKNMLYGAYGLTYHVDIAGNEARCTHQSAPIMVFIDSDDSKAVLNIDDIWPASDTENERTNGELMLQKPSDNCPSIDLGNANTTLNFNGGRITLQNAYPGSDNYTTTLAISHRSYTKAILTLRGMGNDQVGGTVNFNDGTFSILAPSNFGSNATYDTYYRNADGKIDGTALRCPQNTTINGGTFNSNVVTCSEVQSQGGSPKNNKGDYVCMLDLRASGGVDDKGFAVFDFPYGQVSKSDGTTTLAQYYANKSTDYGHASLSPHEGYVHLFLPCDYNTERSAEMDYPTDIWKYALPSMQISGSNASLAANVLGLSGNDLGGPTTINTEENYTKNVLWGRLDEYMRMASQQYEIDDEIAGQQVTGISVTIGENDYSYVTNADEYAIREGQYLLIAVKADKYLSICPPFDVKNVYVVESYPETLITQELNNGLELSAALGYQAYANIDYCYQLAKAAVYSHQGFTQVNSSFKSWGYKKDKEQNGYTGTQSAYNWRGVKKITPNVDFNLHENQEEWSIDENDNYTCDWATADGSDGVWMEKGRNYILQFPAKTENEYWDYWTGKMIIFEGLGEETIQGSNAHATIKASATPSAAGKAVMLGNTTLAEMSVQNEQLYYYDEESGMFLSEPEAEVKIQPAQGFLYVNPKVDPEAPVEVFGIEAYTGKCWYFLTYDENEISVERSAEKKTYKGLDSNEDGTENNRYIYRNDAWVEMTDEDNDHAWTGSNDNTYIYYADAWVIVNKVDGLYTDGDENKYTYDDATSAWKRLSIECGIYSYDDQTFMLINNVLTPVTLNANDPAYRVDGSNPAQFYLDPNGSCAWTAVNVNGDGAYYYGESPYHFYVYLNDAWVAVDRVLNNPNWNSTYIDNSGNYYIRNNDNWLIITGPDENHLYHGSDSKIYIYYGNPADWVAVTHHEDAIYTDGENYYQYNTTSSKWEVVVVDIVVENENYPVVGHQSLHDLTIKDNGSVTISSGNSLTVQNLIIEATPDNNQSGIINGTGMANLTVVGDAYLDIIMNSTGEMDATKYYSFAVPFAVNRADGVQRLNKNTGLWETATFGANYLAYEYDEAERAAHGPSNACWKKVTGDQYVSGKFYLCEFDNDNYNVYRFKASDKSHLNAIANISVSKSSDDALNAGWNGVSGMGISYSKLSGAYGYMFALNSVANAFDIQLANEASLAVGRAVFVQVTAAGELTISQPSSAPARAPQENQINCLRITENGKQKYDDQLFFSASEEAQPVYVAGKDIEKMWMGTPSVARIWAVDYNGLRLAANDAVLVDERADYQLGISTPKNGEYVLSLREAYEDVTVYLTQNGTIIANLTLGEYPVSLEKGETAEYGLRIIVRKSPNVATDFDAAIVDNPNGIHKVIINDMMYIIKNKHVYTTNGQIVK